ncbi:MAG: LPS-assembly protein LptD [Aquificaceae bacterium]|nr:LPS-assembly protein LptD [Aquificaceae bacterium]MDW8423105.1 LPS-assembly protein LptD [Aquificaceae bacterium]
MLLFLLFLFTFSFSFSVEIYSDSLERLPDGTYRAEGEVEAFYRDYYIKADYMTYDPENKVVYARGRVYVKSSDGRLEVKGAEAFLDMQRDVGYFIDAEGSFEKFYFTAERVDKEAQNYLVESGSVTTCPPEKKEMKLCFSRASISQRYVFSQNNTLRLFNLPIAYLPFSFFPVGERRSGLLPPMIGSNTYNNIIYQQPIYWVISPDKDVTLTLDFRDKQAKGISLEYRQSIRKELDFISTLSFYKEPIPYGKWWQGRDLATFRENRYRLKANLDMGNLKAGIDLLSDPYFMQDTYFTTKERTVPYTTTYLSYKKELEDILFTLNLFRFYDTTSVNNRKTLQRLPEVGVYLKNRSLLEPVYFNLTFSYVNFYRDEGLRAHRLLFFPEFSLPKRLMGLNFLSTLTFENLLYIDPKGTSIRDRSAFSIRYKESLPYFFDFKAGAFELKNTFELSYSYRPKGYENPRFDSFDEINKENLLMYTLRSYGYYNKRLFYSLFMEGGYNYLGKFKYLDQEVREKVTPHRAVLGLYPTEWLKLSSDSLYDPVNNRLLKTVSSLTLSSEGKSLTLGRTLEKKYDGSRTNDQYSLSAGLIYGPTNLTFNLIRDNRVKKDLQRQATLDYKGACWSFGLLLRDIYDGTRQKYIKEVFLTFNVFDLQRFTVPLRR